MSNFPDGMAGSRTAYKQISCDDCGYSWEVEGTSDLGDWWAKDEFDMQCPRCQSCIIE